MVAKGELLRTHCIFPATRTSKEHMCSFAGYKPHSAGVQTVILSSNCEGSFNLSEILLTFRIKNKRLEETDGFPRSAGRAFAFCCVDSRPLGSCVYVSISGHGSWEHNNIVLPKIPPKDTEITTLVLRTNYFTKKEQKRRCKKKNLLQALCPGRTLKGKPRHFYLRK